MPISNFNYPYSIIGPPQQNEIIDIAYGPSDPCVTLAQVKNHLRIDFTTDDTYLNSIIPQCQDRVEQYTATSLNERTISVVINNSYGNTELPYGPVISVTTTKDFDGNALTDAIYKGVAFQTVYSPCLRYLTITYQAGYTDDNRPPSLVLALLQEIAYRYENRGDNLEVKVADKLTSGLCESAMVLANPFRRKRFI